MSASDAYKKQIEERDLRLFLRDYEFATGSRITVVRPRERPDFEVSKEGLILGLELVRVMIGPNERLARRLFGEDEDMKDGAASDGVQCAIRDKERKRASAGWAFADATILVVQLISGSGRNLYGYWDEEILEELRAAGFTEIWLSDHSALAPHETVEIIGIKREGVAGVHQHSRCGTKPYG